MVPKARITAQEADLMPDEINYHGRKSLLLKFLLEPIGWYRLTQETRLGVVRAVNPIRYAREIIDQAHENCFQITMAQRSRYTFRPRLQLFAESWDTEAWLRVSSITRVPVKDLTIDESRVKEILAFEKGHAKVMDFFSERENSDPNWSRSQSISRIRATEALLNQDSREFVIVGKFGHSGELEILNGHHRLAIASNRNQSQIGVVLTTGRRFKQKRLWWYLGGWKPRFKSGPIGLRFGPTSS